MTEKDNEEREEREEKEEREVGPSSAELAMTVAGGTSQSEQSSSSSIPSSPSSTTKTAKRIALFRFLLVLSLLASGVISATLSYRFIHEYEDTLYEAEFNSIVSEIYESVNKGLVTKVTMQGHLSLLIGNYCPEKDHWPNCSLPSTLFTALTKSLLDASDSRSMGIAPLVHVSQKQSYEAFVYDYFEQDGGYPSDVGISSFGKGIYMKDSAGHRIPDFTGNVSFSRYHSLYVPLFQVSNLPTNYRGIMYNMHSELVRGQTLDSVFDCSKSLPGPENLRQCSAISDVVQLISDSKPSPASVMYTPIYPEKNNTSLVGVTTLVFNWQNLLKYAVPFHINLYCILKTKSSGYVFLIGNQNATYLGQDCEVDLSESIDRRLKTSRIVVEDTELITTTEYELQFFPHRNFHDEYHSNLPIIACVTCIFIVLVISAIFILFDFFSKREAAKNVALLDSKRVFVRFISHEIRSPLNTIVLGLQVLRTKVASLQALRALSTDPLIPHTDRVDISGALEISSLTNTSVSLPNESCSNTEPNCPNVSSSCQIDVAKEYLECLDIIQELDDNSEAAIVVLNDLINYDKIELKTFTIEKKEVSLGKLIEKTFHSLISQAKHKNIDFTFQMERVSPQRGRQDEIVDTLLLLGDVIKLGQVFRNVISNALKLTPPQGKVSVSVKWFPAEKKSTANSVNSRFNGESLAAYGDGGYAVITVTDTGPGLSKKQLSIICTEGVQFNPNELQAGGGSGLGLWISRQIVDLHGGMMTVSSPGLGLGASFEIKLPLVVSLPQSSLVETNFHESVRTVPTPQNHSMSPQDTTPSDFECRPSMILLVDDATSNRKMLGRILKSNNIQFHEAENGQICLEKFSSRHVEYDLILLDYEMPILNGPNTARKLRELGTKVIIIGVTGNVLPEDTRFFIEHGADAVLPKPLTLKAMLEVYNKLMGERNS